MSYPNYDEDDDYVEVRALDDEALLYYYAQLTRESDKIQHRRSATYHEMSMRGLSLGDVPPQSMSQLRRMEAATDGDPTQA